MADSSGSSSGSASSGDRRSFLKIGAGVVGGLVVGGAIGYLAKGSSTTTSTSTETMSGSNTTSIETTSVTGPTTTETTTETVSGLATTSTVTGPTQTTTTTATVTGPATTQTVTSTTTATCTNMVAALQTQLTQNQAFIILNSVEQAEVEALAEAMIPSDSNGPGAKEAGCVYFIDHQLAGAYGFNAKSYLQGPFVEQGISTPVTLKGVTWSMSGPGAPATASAPTCITYSSGTPTYPLCGGFYYQHPFQIREFWELGLANLETYCNSAYGGNFEALSLADQNQAIADCWANKPTNFAPITPLEFISEVQYMVWNGFVTDPLHGGNQNLVGWTYLAHNGVNEGNFYGCGYTTTQLMVMSTPVRLKPASIGQLLAALNQDVEDQA